VCVSSVNVNAPICFAFRIVIFFLLQDAEVQQVQDAEKVSALSLGSREVLGCALRGRTRDDARGPASADVRGLTLHRTVYVACCQ